MTGKMTRSAADQRAFDASLGLGRRRDGEKRDGNRSASKRLVHVLISRLHRGRLGTPLRIKSSQVLISPPPPAFGRLQLSPHPTIADTNTAFHVPVADGMRGHAMKRSGVP